MLRFIKSSLLSLIVVLVLLFSFPCDADVVTLAGAKSWKLINSHTIMVFSGDIPIALIEFWPYEIILPSSKIEYIDLTVMEFSKMVIDGRVCEIFRVKSLR
jgi:hypothetical protein